jgi:heptosyltransferase-3
MEQMKIKSVKHILLSRTDSIGDVVLTLPMAGWLKENLPDAKISFLGRDYTKSVVEISSVVDDFISYDSIKKMPVSEQLNFLHKKEIDCVIHVFPKSEISSLMKKAAVKWRIGTKNRMYHWFHCNHLIDLSRKNSGLHEAQLNFKLLAPFGMTVAPHLNQIHKWYNFSNISPLEDRFASLLSTDKFNLILHPKSKGSAREWGIENFSSLIENLPKEKYKIFVSGTVEEAVHYKSIISSKNDITDLSGKFNLNQFISFINAADGLVAASTGPLHIAAALGKKAIGLFAPMKPIHPGRWKPLGEKALALSVDKQCDECRKSKSCQCIRDIKVQEVVSVLES